VDRAVAGRRHSRRPCGRLSRVRRPTPQVSALGAARPLGCPSRRSARWAPRRALRAAGRAAGRRLPASSRAAVCLDLRTCSSSEAGLSDARPRRLLSSEKRASTARPFTSIRVRSTRHLSLSPVSEHSGLAPVQARSRLLETANKDLTRWLGRAIRTAAHRQRTLLTADRRAQFKRRWTAPATSVAMRLLRARGSHRQSRTGRRP
jgi:hypothetical protein